MRSQGGFVKKRMEARGLEPLTFRVWGERSSRLSYASMSFIIAPVPKKASGKSDGIENYVLCRFEMRDIISKDAFLK